MSTKCKEILEELAIPCNYIEGHEPVLNYEAGSPFSVSRILIHPK